MEYPKFQAHDKGKCELCGDEDVDLCIIPDYISVCQHCFENEMTMCDVCGQLWADAYVEFTELPDGRLACESCMEDMETDDEDEDEE